MLTCLYCHKPAKVIEGLCWRCRRRGQKKYRGYCDSFAPGELPTNPTIHSPGSEEKIKVMMGRAERRELLHHPDDFVG